jgi:glycosyltransferase involved in cell wall biosynthesis
VFQRTQRPARLIGRDIVCFAGDWNGASPAPRQIVTRLARRNRVLWVSARADRGPHSTVRDLWRFAGCLLRFVVHCLRGGEMMQVHKNIHVLTVPSLPARGAWWQRRINERLVTVVVRAAMRRLRLERPLLYAFSPAGAWAAGRLGEQRLIYHCTGGAPAPDGDGAEIARLEAKLIARSDLLISSSTALHAQKSPSHPRAIVVRSGVELSHFARALDPSTAVPRELADLPRPRLGFFAAHTDGADLEALQKVALAWPSGTLLIAAEWRATDGEARARLVSLPNVRTLGRRPYEDLPGCYKALDVALWPLVAGAATESGWGEALREQLAAGLPVVSTDIPEARAIAEQTSGVYLSDGAAAFPTQVAAALAAAAGGDRTRSAAVEHQSWDEKVAEIEAKLLELET